MNSVCTATVVVAFVMVVGGLLSTHVSGRVCRLVSFSLHALIESTLVLMSVLGLFNCPCTH